MTSDLMLRGKWTLRTGGQTVVFKKNSNEKSTHVLMKAFLWALYLPEYPGLTVEVRVGDRYKPDVVAVDSEGTPSFWGESGKVGLGKLRSLVKRYPTTHFAIAKWEGRLSTIVGSLKGILDAPNRAAPFDVLVFSADSAERFIGDRGRISVSFEDIEWRRFEP